MRSHSTPKRSHQLLYSSLVERILLAVVVMVGLIVTSRWVSVLEQSRLESKRARAVILANNKSNTILRTIENPLNATYVMAALVRQGNGEISKFDKIAADLSSRFPAADTLVILPGGVVQKIYPLKGNEKAIGNNRFQDPTRKEIAVQTRDSRQLTLDGPFPLIKGSKAATAKLPVFLEREDGTEFFWGFTSVTIRIPELLKLANLSSLTKSGFNYRLVSVDTDSKKEILIDSSSKLPLEDPVSNSFAVANMTWKLSVAPIEGWSSKSLKIRGWLVGILLIILLITLIKLLFQAKRSEQQLQHMAHFDALTGLPNRRLFYERLEQAIAIARRSNTTLAVCYLDLDGFKKINDTLGHAAGDAVLVHVAHQFKKCVRQEDMVSRLGGDEFTIVLTGFGKRKDVAEKEYSLVLERIIAKTSLPPEISNSKLSISPSIGVTIFPRDANTVDELVQRADETMYRVKLMGKAHYSFYNSVTHCE